MLWRRFVETHATIVRRLDENLRAQSGLTLSSFEVLYELVKAPGNQLRMAELADRLLFTLTRSGVARASSTASFVTATSSVTECVHDGRGVYAILTEKGFELFERAATRTSTASAGSSSIGSTAGTTSCAACSTSSRPRRLRRACAA